MQGESRQGGRCFWQEEVEPISGDVVIFLKWELPAKHRHIFQRPFPVVPYYWRCFTIKITITH